MKISDPGFWPAALKNLRLQMTEATYNAHLKKSQVKTENGKLIILADNPLALDWLQHRMYKIVENAIASLADDPKPEVEFRLRPPREGLGEEGYQPELVAQGTYRDAYNAIVQPNKQHYCSRYYHQKWLPILGPELWLIIWELRTRCSWDWQTGEVRRDTVEITYEKLGEAVRLSRLQAWRLLNPKDPDRAEIVRKFITRTETKRRYSSSRGGKVNDKTLFKVRLDDPLTPEDEINLANFTGENS